MVALGAAPTPPATTLRQHPAVSDGWCWQWRRLPAAAACPIATSWWLLPAGDHAKSASQSAPQLPHQHCAASWAPAWLPAQHPSQHRRGQLPPLSLHTVAPPYAAAQTGAAAPAARTHEATAALLPALPAWLPGLAATTLTLTLKTLNSSNRSVRDFPAGRILAALRSACKHL